MKAFTFSCSIKAYSHENEIINKTPTDDSAQCQTSRWLIQITTSADQNADISWRCFLANHQSVVALYFMQTLCQSL